LRNPLRSNICLLCSASGVAKMVSMRKKLPKSTEAEILVRNRSCCCICQDGGVGKEVIVHHIDGDNSHNDMANLAVLCLVHASSADAGLRKGKLGAGKKLAPELVIEYKKRWEQKIAEELKISEPISFPYGKLREELLRRLESHLEANRKKRLSELKDELSSYVYLSKKGQKKLASLIMNLNLVASDFEFYDILREIAMHTMNSYSAAVISQLLLEIEIKTAVYDDILFYPANDRHKGHQQRKLIADRLEAALSIFWELGNVVIEYHESEKLMTKITEGLTKLVRRIFKFALLDQLRSVIRLCGEFGLMSIGIEYGVSGYKFKNFSSGIKGSLGLLSQILKQLGESKFTESEIQTLKKDLMAADENIRREYFYRTEKIGKKSLEEWLEQSRKKQEKWGSETAEK
jgi:hypothetical protein